MGQLDMRTANRTSQTSVAANVRLKIRFTGKHIEKYLMIEFVIYRFIGYIQTFKSAILIGGNYITTRKQSVC